MWQSGESHFDVLIGIQREVRLGEQGTRPKVDRGRDIQSREVIFGGLLGLLRAVFPFHGLVNPGNERQLPLLCGLVLKLLLEKTDHALVFERLLFRAACYTRILLDHGLQDV